MAITVAPIAAVLGLSLLNNHSLMAKTPSPIQMAKA
jgi:hypothetical protein